MTTLEWLYATAAVVALGYAVWLWLAKRRTGDALAVGGFTLIMLNLLEPVALSRAGPALGIVGLGMVVASIIVRWLRKDETPRGPDRPS